MRCRKVKGLLRDQRVSNNGREGIGVTIGDLVAGGTMGERIRAYDWSASPLGPIESWPASLRVTLSNLLCSKFPTSLAWGPELITFYNDAYLALRGIRPEALGQPLPQAWTEVWNGRCHVNCAQAH
jgi:hypothetical protein